MGSVKSGRKSTIVGLLSRTDGEEEDIGVHSSASPTGLAATSGAWDLPRAPLKLCAHEQQYIAVFLQTAYW